MNHRAESPVIADEVRRLLRERYLDHPESSGVAIAAAIETTADAAVLDELARAWHVTRIEQAQAAAGLSGAIAAVAHRLSEAEIVERTGVPAATVRALSATLNESATSP